MICRDSKNWEQSRMSNQTVNLPYPSMGIPPPSFGVRYHASLTIERDPNSGILEGPVKTLAQPCALPIQSWPVVWQRAGGSGAEVYQCFSSLILATSGRQSSLVACCWTIVGYLFVRDIWKNGISAQIKCFTSFRPVDPFVCGKGVRWRPFWRLVDVHTAAVGFICACTFSTFSYLFTELVQLTYLTFHCVPWVVSPAELFVVEDCWSLKLEITQITFTTGEVILWEYLRKPYLAEVNADPKQKP